MVRVSADCGAARRPAAPAARAADAASTARREIMSVPSMRAAAVSLTAIARLAAIPRGKRICSPAPCKARHRGHRRCSAWRSVRTRLAERTAAMNRAPFRRLVTQPILTVVLRDALYGLPPGGSDVAYLPAVTLGQGGGPMSNQQS